jgi:GH24 family phage-related lysozyme (muramidase)
MGMTMGTKGLELLKSFESCSLKAYKLSNESNYTIGWGHSDSSIKANDKITQAKADAYLKEDLKYFENLVNNNTKGLNQNQFDALVDYTYNRGIKGLKQLLENSKTNSDISDNILVYWGSNTAYKTGLMRRRKAEKALFDTATSSKSKSSSSKNPYTAPGDNITLKVGTVSSTYVKWLQYELKCTHGYSITIDGEYGSKTAAAVKCYQKLKGLTKDGIAGPKTIAQLKKDA